MLRLVADDNHRQVVLVVKVAEPSATGHRQVEDVLSLRHIPLADGVGRHLDDFAEFGFANHRKDLVMGNRVNWVIENQKRLADRNYTNTKFSNYSISSHLES